MHMRGPRWDGINTLHMCVFISENVFPWKNQLLLWDGACLEINRTYLSLSVVGRSQSEVFISVHQLYKWHSVLICHNNDFVTQSKTFLTWSLDQAVVSFRFLRNLFYTWIRWNKESQTVTSTVQSQERRKSLAEGASKCMWVFICVG